MADNSALLKNGNKILIENEPYLVIENDFVNPGKGQAFTRVKVRNLLNKKIIDEFDVPDIFINCSYPRTEDWGKNNFEDISLNSFRKNKFNEHVH